MKGSTLSTILATLFAVATPTLTQASYAEEDPRDNAAVLVQSPANHPDPLTGNVIALNEDTPVITDDFDWTGSQLTINREQTLKTNAMYTTLVEVQHPIDSVINHGTLTTSPETQYGSSPMMVWGHVRQLINTGTLYNGYGNGLDIADHLEIADWDGGVDRLSNTATGVIYGESSGIDSMYTTLGTINNQGRVEGELTGMRFNGVQVSTLRNATGGILTGGYYGVSADNASVIKQLVNEGLLSGGLRALRVTSNSHIDKITNTGTIAGDIISDSDHDLLIGGGTKTAGLLTGHDDQMGTINASNANLVFTDGRQWLDDNIIVKPGGSVHNQAATIELSRPVTVTGNYLQDADATLAIQVADGALAQGRIADTGYGRLIVTGTATLEPGAGVSLRRSGSTYRFAPGQRYVVLQSAQADYDPDTLAYQVKGFNGEVSAATRVREGSTNLVVTLGQEHRTDQSTDHGGTARDAATRTATVRNAIASLNGLSRYTDIEPDLLNLYNAAQAIDTTAQANHTGQQLSPAQPLALVTTAQAPTFDVLNLVSDRVNTLRQTQGPTQSLPDTFASAPANFGAWMQGLAGHTAQSPREGTEGYHANYNGVILGIDHRLNPGWAAGMAVADSQTRVRGERNESGVSTRIRQDGLFAYTSKTADAWYANLSLGAARQRYHSQRTVEMPGFRGRPTAAFGGQQYVANGEWGLRQHAYGLDLTPHVGLRYSYLHQNAYAESGGNGAALSVGGAHGQSATTRLGLTVSKLFSFGRNDVAPSLDVSWRHELVHGRWSTQSQFRAAPDGMTSFTTLGPKPASDLAEMSLGVAVLHGGSLSLKASYDLQAGGGFVAQGASLRLLKTF